MVRVEYRDEEHLMIDGAGAFHRPQLAAVDVEASTEIEVAKYLSTSFTVIW